MRVAGADVCRKGWVAVLYDGSTAEVCVFPDFESLWDELRAEVRLVLADIPIGLPAAKRRSCDVMARRLLGWPRSSSIFPVPCRQAVYASSYREASMLSLKLTGRRLSLQSWNICARIREVDALLLECRRAREKVRETHPEVCFAGLAGRAMRHSKRSEAGREERRRVLRRWCGSAEAADVPAHDLLDALAAAVSAWLGVQQGFEVLPAKPEHDSMGLRMEILYAKGG